MIDAVSTADDRLRIVLILAENDLTSVTGGIQDDNGTSYRLRARSLEADETIHVEESIATDGEDFLDIARYDRAAIDELAVMHRKQVRELHVRQNHPQSHLERRQKSRTRQKVRNRKALQDGFDDARLESWSRRKQVTADA